MKRDLAGVGSEWGGVVETVSGEGSETGSVTKKKGNQISTTSIGASLTRTPGIKKKQQQFQAGPLNLYVAKKTPPRHTKTEQKSLPIVSLALIN